MTFEAALRSELVTISGLSNKVFPIRAPEGTEAPYLIYTTSVGEYDKSLDGWHKSKSVAAELNILHNSITKLRALTREVMALVMTFEGKTLGETGPVVDEIVFEGDSVEMYEPQADLYRKVINMRIYYEEE